MVTVKPFEAIRPPRNLVTEVAAPPYDVLNSVRAKKMRIIDKLLLFFVFVPILSGCLKWSKDQKEVTWDKDYYDYHIGAMINGEEYHELQWTGLALAFKHNLSYGFSISRSSNNPLLFFQSYPTSAVLKGKGATYCLDMSILMDSTAFRNLVFPAVFQFNGNTDYGRGLASSQELDLESVTLPRVFAWIGRYMGEYTYKDFYAQDGFIWLGKFGKDMNNQERVTFELTAKSTDGEVIEVKQGYFNIFEKVR